MKTIFIITFILLLQPMFACTIVYTAAGDRPLGGANEDYSDPYTYMTVYPAEEGKLGWIKFSFAGGFPQAGMNESGVFWDGASAPWLDMPFSVENKELYDGPLMQKVIEECSSCQEAQTVFSQYYCSDQFNAQYLIGDSTGISMIVEGDEIVVNEGSYQVLTNFNINHPGSGGYPCWRYDTAMQMFSEGEHDTYQVGSILSATHQIGQYPTLYSNIFDLTELKIYLFFQHNFDEFIKVDLQEQLDQGFKRYLINQHFSGINYRFPEDQQTVNSTSVEISWQGWLTSSYELQYSLDPEMEDYESIFINGKRSLPIDDNLLFPIVGCFFLMGFCCLYKRSSILMIITLLIIILIMFGCSDDERDNFVGKHRITISDLDDGSSYYWRVLAEREADVFTSQTSIFQFNVEQE